MTVSLLLGPGAHAAPERILGFGPASADAELQNEKSLDASINPSDERAWLQQLASEPNQVGSPHDKANADFLLAQFKAWGWDARIETFSVLYPTPKSVSLEMVAPEPFKARLSEEPQSKDKAALPPYAIYGADGDVTGELVYVNYGMPEDYEELVRLGIDVSGKVVIARYGGGWRGLKPKLAAQHGAIGCLIYSDPRDDGYWQGDAYPKGPFRPEDGVQRGSVADLTLYPGDPQALGGKVEQGAPRPPLSEAKSLAGIPVLPISYSDARPLLQALGGPVAPASWRGALPFTYHVGSGPAKVHLSIASDWSQREIYDVVAVLEGSDYPNQWVLRGNHHDGWVNGAWDPLSGTVSLMSEAKAIGTLARTGWRPKRTIVYLSWDGEEPGLLGSTEWVEAHRAELMRKAFLYFNSDSNARGVLYAGGSSSLERLVNEVASSVGDPEVAASVGDRLRATLKVIGAKGSGGESDALFASAESGGDLPLSALGAGSDYSPFLDHLGIASLDFEFRSGANDGIYHSAYDTFEHFDRFGDPGFAYSATLARTVGRVVLRSADADLLPVRFTSLADAVTRYVVEIQKQWERERDEAKRVSKLIDDGTYRLAFENGQALQPPERPAEVPRLDFRPLSVAAARLRMSAAAFDSAYARALTTEPQPSTGQLADVNRLLLGFEQTLLLKSGLPGRAWYRHALYAPGALTGYSAKTIPGVREAVEQGRWSDASEEMNLAASAIESAAKRLDEASSRLVPRIGMGNAGVRPTPTPPPDN